MKLGKLLLAILIPQHLNFRLYVYKFPVNPCHSWLWSCSQNNGHDCQKKVFHWDTLLVSVSPSQEPCPCAVHQCVYLQVSSGLVLSNVLCVSRMAPEVAAVEKNGGYNQLCDIWAVGITSIELAELQPPMFDLHPMRFVSLLGIILWSFLVCSSCFIQAIIWLYLE